MQNDEIKEKKTKRIIEKIEGLATYVTIPRELAIYNVNIDSQEAKLLIDYITNLQQQYEGAILVGKELNKENERLKEIIDSDNESYDIQETIINRQKSELLEQEDYKSRCEKANWWLKEMLKQAKSDETKAIINGTLDLLLNGRSDE